MFIDGSHDYESVKQDFETWSKFVRPQGFILMHDTEINNFGVGKFYDEIYGPFRLEFNRSCGLGVLTRRPDLREEMKEVVGLFLKSVYRCLQR